MRYNRSNAILSCSILLVLLVLIFPSQSRSDTFTIPASSDAEERNGTVYTGPGPGVSRSHFVYYQNADQYAAYRFGAVDIPPGSTINSAYITFKSTSTYWNNNDNPVVTIYGEKSATPSALAGSANNISTRPLTTAFADWSPRYNTVTPDLKDVLSEILDLSTDSSRTFLLITKSSKTSATQWIRFFSTEHGTASSRPTLTINFTPPPKPTIHPNPQSLALGPTAFEGYDAPTETFEIQETSGLADFIGTVSVSAPWLSVTVPNGGFTAANPLVKGTTATITVDYDTSSLPNGVYYATISFNGTGTNTPRIINVTLFVKDIPATAACGEIPLYAQNKVDPAIMVQLDTSGSMGTQMPILASGKNPRSPNLKDIVQEIVNRAADPVAGTDGWKTLNNMAFVISGTGDRKAYSYDGQPIGSSSLRISYSTSADPATVIEKEFDLALPEDDVQKSGTTLNTNADTIYLGRANDPVGLLFRNIDVPQGATILEADLQFIISNATSTTTNLTVKGVAQDSAPLFTTVGQLSNDLTTASVAWAVESWGNTMTRIAIAKDVLKEVYLDQTINWGHATWAGGSCGANETPPANDWTTYRVGIRPHDATHQSNLQTKVNDGSASGCTPLAPTMNAALEYFKGNRNSAAGSYGEAYTPSDCQPKILVLVTDGIGNTATTMQKIRDNLALLHAQNVSVVAVGFGIRPSESGQLYEIAKLAQEKGNESKSDAIYALHKENASKVGLPYLAQSREDFIDAMNSIVSSVKTNLFYGSAPAASTSVNTGEILLSSTFSASDWSGDLSARKFNSITSVLESTPTWTAQTKNASTTPSSFIQDSGSPTMVGAYTDSSLANDRYLCKFLGDIINSTPKIVNTPPYWYNFDNYSAFKYNQNVYTRTPLAYVASNDGALHAFELSSGLEKWRFYPDSVKSKLNEMALNPQKDMCSTAYCHRFIFDGSPQAADVYNGSSWKTVLVTGLGKGGSSYLGLDVTYGNAPSTSAAAPATEKDTPTKYLWEFTDATLGYATAFPEIERVADATVTTGSKWLVFLGSGEHSTNQAAQKAYVYGFNVFDAAPAWLDSNDNPINKMGIDPADRSNDIPASPTTVDLDDDYKIDRLYVGNNYGTMARLSGIGYKQKPALSTLFYSNNINTPIGAKVSFAYAGDPDNDKIQDIWVYFGTGRFETQLDKFTDYQQYFYGLFDPEGSKTNNANTYDSAYVAANLFSFSTTIVSAYAVDSSGNKVDLNGDGNITVDDMRQYRTISCTSPVNGKCNVNNESWQLALHRTAGEPSERSLNRALVDAGIVYFTTFIPGDDPCQGNGTSWIFAVDFETGSVAPGPIFDLNKDGKFTGADTKVELPDGTEVEVVGFKIGDSQANDLVKVDNTIFVSDKDSPPTALPTNPGLNKAKLRAWRQLINN